MTGGPGSDGEREEAAIDLEGLEEAPGAGFMERVRGRIERRRLVSDTAELSVSAVMVMFLQFAEVVSGLFRRGDREGGETR